MTEDENLTKKIGYYVTEEIQDMYITNFFADVFQYVASEFIKKCYDDVEYVIIGSPTLIVAEEMKVSENGYRLNDVDVTTNKYHSEFNLKITRPLAFLINRKPYIDVSFNLLQNSLYSIKNEGEEYKKTFTVFYDEYLEFMNDIYVYIEKGIDVIDWFD